MELELGSSAVGRERTAFGFCLGGAWGSGEGGGNLTLGGGGECDACDGCDEGGDIEVMSTEGDHCRFVEDYELRDGVSSGGGGRGRTKWNSREAIWIWDLISGQRHSVVDLDTIGGIYLSPNGARVPAADQTPSTQAPLRLTTTSTKQSSSWSYSILA